MPATRRKISNHQSPRVYQPTLADWLILTRELYQLAKLTGTLARLFGVRDSRRNLGVAFNSVVIWKLTDLRNRNIDKPESPFLNAGVFDRLVLSYIEKRPCCNDDLSARRKSYWMENTSTILAKVSAERLINKKFPRQILRFSVVNSHRHSAYVRTPLPEPLSQQEAVSVGRPIDKVNAVPELFS